MDEKLENHLNYEKYLKWTMNS